MDSLLRLMETFFKPINWIAAKLEEHYPDRLAGIPQVLFLLGFLIIVSSPFLIYVALLTLQLQPPLCYISFSAWIAFMGFIFSAEVFVSYAEAKRLIQSLSRDFKWDIEKYSKEYFELLERQQIKSKKRRKWF
jgi:hypothetical protein